MERFLAIWENHKGKLTGALIGLIFGVSVMMIGFFWTLFISGCVLIGFFIGKRIDEEKESLGEILEKYFPLHTR